MKLAISLIKHFNAYTSLLLTIKPDHNTSIPTEDYNIKESL